MSLIKTPWTSQPQQAVGIDWSNPITNGLLYAFIPTQTRDFVRGAPATYYNGVATSASGVAAVSNNNYVPIHVGASGLNAAPNGEVTFVAVCPNVVLLGSNPGLWRSGVSALASGSAGTGTSFFIFQGTSFLPWVRVNGFDVLRPSSGQALSVGQSYTIAFSAKAQSFAKVAWNGAVKHSATHSTNFVNLLYSYVGAQNTSTERIGDIAAFFQFDRALTDSELASITANPWQIFKPIPRRIFVPVSVGGTPTLYPSLYTNDNSFYSPAVSVGDVTLTPSLFSNSNTFHSATVTLGGATQTLTPSLYSNTNTFYGHSVSPGAVTLTPALFSNTNSFFGAVVTLDSDKILYPTLVSNSNSFYGPTLSVGAVSLLPSLFVNSNTFYNHVVGGALTDSEKIDLILDILSNRQTLDATTGIYTLYADDGVTVIKTAQAWEDSEGTQPYRGRGLKRLDALQ